MVKIKYEPERKLKQISVKIPQETYRFLSKFGNMSKIIRFIIEDYIKQTSDVVIKSDHGILYRKVEGK